MNRLDAFLVGAVVGVALCIGALVICRVIV